MKILITGHREDETALFTRENSYGFAIAYTPDVLTTENVALTQGYDAVGIIAATVVNEELCAALKGNGVRYILTRTAGVDHLNQPAIKKYGLRAASVPVYSPSSIAEHTVMLMLELLRKRTMQYRRIENYDFRLAGLRGMELRTKVVGVVGTGRIGAETIRMLGGFGCRILASDLYRNPEVESLAVYTELDELLKQSDIVVFHCPLTADNHHIINAESIKRLRPGAMLVNTARGGLIDSEAVLAALQEGKLSGYAFDVYEFENTYKRLEYHRKPFGNELLERLIAHDRVIFTTHTAFYTDEAIGGIIGTTLFNLNELITTGQCANEL